MADDSGRNLHLPVDRAPTAAAVVLHPHPAMGGDRNHPLVVAVAEGLAAAGIAALRIDLADPDVDRSAERLDEVASELVAEVGAERLFLVGYSWGSIVSATARPAALAARVLVAPPVSMAELPTPTDDTASLLLVPVHDQYGGPDAVRTAVAGWPEATVEDIDGCDHFLVGAISRIADRTVAWLADR